ncbi:MAG: hypothetical protein K0S65_1724 [Labilithrix sp.]|nr:hypothetical protein [Labilithrix sp.]
MLDALAAKTVPSRSMTRDLQVNTAPRTLSRLVRPLATAVVLGGSLLFVAGPGCGDEGIGDPCTPEQEFNADFLGFDEKEVNVESKSFQCRTRLCLVNHFRGRVSCPYGQSAEGTPPAGAKSACTIPGTDTPIEGAKDPATNDFVDTRRKSSVAAQCVDRSADKAVYCSCRCADINGQRPSDQTFCDCPDGFQCERLVTSIGQGNEGLTGSYCIKSNTKYDPTTACTQGDCDPNDKTRACN